MQHKITLKDSHIKELEASNPNNDPTVIVDVELHDGRTFKRQMVIRNRYLVIESSNYVMPYEIARIFPTSHK